MSLALYKKKRSFNKTPEPEDKKKSMSKKARPPARAGTDGDEPRLNDSVGQAVGRGLKFVVQKHDATNLHYDFRLEMEGVLKSWAVPKGPSMNPQDKRLAMMVEDHPYDYRNFEGTIPAGNYGAGTVMVWDEGVYDAMEHAEEPVKTQEKILLEELKKGDLKFVLHGDKLKGAFALVKMKGRGENAWLLIKKNDEKASATDITKKDKSVKTDRTLNQIAEVEGGRIRNRSSAKKKKSTLLLLNGSTEKPVKKNSHQ